MSSNNKHNASISKTDTLLQCSYWASPNLVLPREIGDLAEPPRFGRGFHKCTELDLTKRKVPIKAIAKEFDVDHSKLESYYRRWKEMIVKFFKKKKWEDRQMLVEQKIAVDPFQDTVRFLKSTKERDYTQMRATELPGTGDLAMPPRYNDRTVVIDWKSGQSNYDAKENGQLKSLGLGFDRHFNPNESAGAYVAIIRIDDEFIELSEAFIGPKKLEKHRKALKVAIRGAIEPNPALRIGPHCKYCIALEVCPAHQQPMALADTIDAMEPEQIGHLYDRLIPADKLLEKLRARVNDYIDSNGSVPRENGKWLVREPYTEENLSKASIKRKLGEVKGHELIEKLRKMGVIETTEGMRLRSVIDPAARRK